MPNQTKIIATSDRPTSHRLILNCPICQKITEWSPENRFRPFCSERCKLIDLGGVGQ
ncbi:DNA gyrase inhibitor YacG [Microbulbifer celer]|uniref:DNA gyrase inhibitor YacG n=1 Tax=Microbulbifer celer TaxID=435905 RepID=UPI0038B2B048